jgi:hypothetical protein
MSDMTTKNEKSSEFWTLEDLTEEERDEVSSLCEPGKFYVGDPLAGIRVFNCPFCRGFIHLEKGNKYAGCAHVVFCYDVTNGGYFYLNQDFKEFFLKKNKSYFKGIEAMARDKIDFDDVHPRDMKKLVPGTKLLENIIEYGPGDVVGVIFGVYPVEKIQTRPIKKLPIMKFL